MTKVFVTIAITCYFLFHSIRVTESTINESFARIKKYGRYTEPLQTAGGIVVCLGWASAFTACMLLIWSPS